MSHFNKNKKKVYTVVNNIKYYVYIDKCQKKVGNTFTVVELELQLAATVSHTELR